MGFYFIVDQPLGKSVVLSQVDSAWADADFHVEVAIKYGFEYRYYRRNEREPVISASYEFGPSSFGMAFHPVKHEHFAVYGSDLLTKVFAEVCIKSNAALGRTFGESLYGTVKHEEVASSLQFVDWYQYLSKSIVQRLGGTEFLKQGPFFKVEEYANGACGIWLAPSPDQFLGRQRAAKYLGIELPKLYGKNPITGNPIGISWN